MPHYVILSPLDDPFAYVVFGITNLSCLICILISFYFYRTKKEAWWLLVAVAFAMPLIVQVTYSLSRGLPLLPYGEETLETSTGIVVKGIKVNVNLPSSILPLMAIALGWAYLADRKKRPD